MPSGFPSVHVIGTKSCCRNFFLGRSSPSHNCAICQVLPSQTSSRIASLRQHDTVLWRNCTQRTIPSYPGGISRPIHALFSLQPCGQFAVQAVRLSPSKAWNLASFGLSVSEDAMAVPTGGPAY